MKIPEFKNTHLFDRLCWAKENLEPIQSDYRVVYEQNIDEPAKVLVPEAKPDFVKHTRGYLLHETDPVEPMTEEQAIEYLIMKDIPREVWQTWDEGNKPKMVICRKQQLPSTREWRNAWRISEDLEAA